MATTSRDRPEPTDIARIGPDPISDEAQVATFSKVGEAIVGDEEVFDKSVLQNALNRVRPAICVDITASC